jgi:hypothetical protein
MLKQVTYKVTTRIQRVELHIIGNEMWKLTAVFILHSIKQLHIWAVNICGPSDYSVNFLCGLTTRLAQYFNLL